ncbi:MAG: heparan-alpha-glucosaminide N-acetyltransferase domain-containing protein [Ginsengibacter sp.]
MTNKPATSQADGRLLSLDFLRGLIMISLMIGETGFFVKLYQGVPNSFTHLLSVQFEHSEWHGLTYWDVILPAFMTLAGTAMAFSYKKQQQSGWSWKQSFSKILKRSFWLLFWGILIYSVRGQHLNWQLSNVLTQLAFSTLIAFSVINKPAWLQLTAGLLCLLIPEILFRSIHIAGFDQPFVEFHNFGSYINKSLGIKIDSDHKTNFINFIASGAHTIWGLMAGQLLFSDKRQNQKLRYLLSFGLLVVLGLCYEWIDVRKKQNHLKFFTIVGMNSIFIYLFFIFIGDKWLNGYMETLCSQLLNLANVPLAIGAAISCIIVFMLEWYLCYYLYKKKIFFKL